MTQSYRNLAGVGLLVLLLAGLLGCDANDDEVPARIRVIHAAAGAGDAEAFIDGELLTRGLSFRGVAPYVAWEPGLQLLEFRTTVNGEAVSVSRQVLIDAETDYTVILAAAGESFAVVLVTDDRSTIAFGRARVQVVNAAPSAPTVSVSIADASTGASALSVPALPFGEGTAHVTVEEGTYAFLAEGASAGQRIEVPGQEIAERRVYLLVVASTAGGGLTGFFVVDG